MEKKQKKNDYSEWSGCRAQKTDPLLSQANHTLTLMFEA